MLSQQDCDFLTGLVGAAFTKAAEAKPLEGLQLLLPTLAGGGAGALYGASQAPGGSPARGAIAGGLAGAGAGAAFTGAHQALTSPYGSAMGGSPAVAATLLLGAAGLGGAGGLRAGRHLADKAGLPDKHHNNELSELDLSNQKTKSLLPKELRNYFSG